MHESRQAATNASASVPASTYERNVEVIARNHVRQRQAVGDAKVRDDQVVDVALVRRQQQHGAALGGGSNQLDAVLVDVDAEQIQHAEDLRRRTHQSASHSRCHRLECVCRTAPYSGHADAEQAHDAGARVRGHSLKDSLGLLLTTSCVPCVCRQSRHMPSQ